MSRTDGLLGLAVVVLLAACSEAQGDDGATTTSGSGGAATTIATGPAPASSSSGSGGDGGSGAGGSETSTGGTTGQGGCPEPGPPEVCNAIERAGDCAVAGCFWQFNANYFSIVGGECEESFHDFCLSLDQCVTPQYLQGYFLGEHVIQSGGPCGRLQGWTPCTGAETDPPACACTVDELTCE